MDIKTACNEQTKIPAQVKTAILHLIRGMYEEIPKQAAKRGVTIKTQCTPSRAEAAVLMVLDEINRDQFVAVVDAVMAAGVRIVAQKRDKQPKLDGAQELAFLHNHMVEHHPNTQITEDMVTLAMGILVGIMAACYNPHILKQVLPPEAFEQIMQGTKDVN